MVVSLLMPDRILVCVAWPYANNSLHLGHVAGSLLGPDIFARYHRMIGDHVLMVSGSDEHGTPITVTADKEGIGPREVADRYHKEHVDNLGRLGISFDLFFRTSDPAHAVVVQDMFKVLMGKGLIYEAEMEALYCGKCARSLPDRYVEGTCPFCGAPDARGDQCDECKRTMDAVELKAPRCKICGTAPEQRTTKHMFLKLSALADGLDQWIGTRKGIWRPSVVNFTRNWLKEGLRDRPITRDLKWGVAVPVPGYDDKCIYVWFEAVIGYLSTSKEWARRRGTPDEWRLWWDAAGGKEPEVRSYYFLGKDNIPFHTIIWPAILMGHGGLNLPYDVPANEHLTMRGQKMSKSRGVMMPLPFCLEKLDADVIRFSIAVSMPENHDSDFSYDEFVRLNNEVLVSTFGNLINRALLFAWKNFGGIPPVGAPLTDRDKALIEAIAHHQAEMTAHLEICRFAPALKELMALAQAGNVYINEAAPWNLIKTDKAACATVMHVCCRLSRALAIMAAPFMPFSSHRIWSMLGEKGDVAVEPWASALSDIDVAGPAARPMPKPEPLFKKLEPDMFTPRETAYQSLVLKVGKVDEVAPHPDAEKLFVMKVDVGEGAPRQIVTGLRGYYKEEELKGRKAVFILNLKPSKLRGIESQGMILAAETEGGKEVSILVPEGDPAVGTVVTAGPDMGPGEASQKVLSLDEFRAVPLRIGQAEGGRKGAVFIDQAAGGKASPLRTPKGPVVPLRDVPDGCIIH